MKLIPSTTSQMALLLIGFAGLSSAIMVWLIRAPQVKIIAESQEVAWHLPTLPATNPQAAFDKMRQLQAWGKDAEVAEVIVPPPPPPPPPPIPEKPKTDPITWGLVGTVTQGEKRFILIIDSLDNSHKIKRYQEATTLPDGTVIMGVEGDRIRIRDKQDEYKVLKLYQPPETTQKK